LVDDGKRVALIEMDLAGGTCLNHGCKPTKALRSSASVAHQARRAAAYGVHTGEVTVDFAAAMSQVRSIINGMRDSLDTLSQARASGRNVLKAEVSMSSVSRAILEGETTGLMRILVDADTEEFLGATILGLHGDDLNQNIGTAMQAGVRYPAVRDALPIHPTMAEFIPSALGSLQPLD
jgi:pyruvate/2-oxoglutarate dehydrogenase complex dihydrolipoamide dehydrogenase (E3) component